VVQTDHVPAVQLVPEVVTDPASESTFQVIETVDPDPPWQKIASFTAEVASSVGTDEADPPVNWAEMDIEPIVNPQSK